MESGEGTSVAASETGSGGTGAPTTSMASTTAVGSTTVDSSGGSDPTAGFVVTPDLPPSEPVQCDVFEQACDEGKKCAPVGDGDLAWCVAVLGAGVAGEPCTAESGGATGVDDCALGHLCWYLDARGDGTCVALCTGSSLWPICAKEFACTVLADDSALWLCLPKCDPLVQDCSDGEICVSYFEFVCLPDASGDEGQVNDPCFSVDDCDPGLVCTNLASAACDPQRSPSCCSAFCQLPDGACPNVDQECVPWYAKGEAPAGDEDIGVCAIPL